MYQQYIYYKGSLGVFKPYRKYLSMYVLYVLDLSYVLYAYSMCSSTATTIHSNRRYVCMYISTYCKCNIESPECAGMYCACAKTTF